MEEPPDPGIAVSRQRDGGDVMISVQAFTPILGTLLLSSNGSVSGPARCTVVDLLGRIRKADDAHEPGSANTEPLDHGYGLFGRAQRQMLEEELIHQLVIGIGRLDASAEDEDAAEIYYDATARTPAGEFPGGRHCASSSSEDDQASVNPYFPHPASYESSTPHVATTTNGFLSSSLPVPLFQLTPEASCGDPPPVADVAFRCEVTCAGKLHPHAEAHLSIGLLQPDQRSARKGGGEPDEDLDSGEQAAVGRLSSMSLIAAVAAGGRSSTKRCIHPSSTVVWRLGSLRLDDQRAFIREVERAGKDPIHWVRREASFALGALAKVIPEELVVSALVRAAYVPSMIDTIQAFV